MSDADVDVVALAIDDGVCIGSGQCEMLEEETFVVDDDTVIAAVIGSGSLPRDRAERVVDTCPSGAISIVVSADAGSDDRHTHSGDGEEE